MRNSRHMLMAATVSLALAMPTAAFAKAAVLAASLDGASETAGGHATGSGSFKGELDPATGDVCYTLAVDGIGDVLAAHIHEGAAGTDGPPVVTINVTGADSDVCVAAEPDLLTAITAAPETYYVNVHTKEHPKGAVRGQLMAQTGE